MDKRKNKYETNIYDSADEDEDDRFDHDLLDVQNEIFHDEIVEVMLNVNREMKEYVQQEGIPLLDNFNSDTWCDYIAHLTK